MGDDRTLVRDYSLVGAESVTAVQKGLAEAAWYTTPIPREKMRELLVRKDGPAIRDTLIWFGLMLGSGYLVFLWWGSWLAILPYIVYSVLYASTSDSRWHESSHGTAFKTDWMNNFLYEVSSFMVLRQSTVWRYSHARHHSDTIIRGRDPEIAVPRPPDIKKLILVFFGISSSIPEWKKIIKHASGKIDPQVATYVPVSEHGNVIFKARVYVTIFLDGYCVINCFSNDFALDVYRPSYTFGLLADAGLRADTTCRLAGKRARPSFELSHGLHEPHSSLPLLEYELSCGASHVPAWFLITHFLNCTNW